MAFGIVKTVWFIQIETSMGKIVFHSHLTCHAITSRSYKKREYCFHSYCRFPIWVNHKHFVNKLKVRNVYLFRFPQNFFVTNLFICSKFIFLVEYVKCTDNAIFEFGDEKHLNCSSHLKQLKLYCFFFFLRNGTICETSRIRHKGVYITTFFNNMVD